MALETKMSSRDAVSFVERNMKLGSEVVHKPTGTIYIIGAKHGMSNFWMMKAGGNKKGLVSAATIAKDFEVTQ